MRIVITGTNGFIGGNLLNELKDGNEILEINEDIFDTRYSDNIGEIIIVIGQSLAENLAVLLLGEDNNGNPLLTIEHKIAVSQYAMERLLGAPVGSVNIFDLGRLRQWFEADEIVAERSMDTQDAAAIPTA